MTIQETGLIMDVLAVAYPQFYKSQSDDDRFAATQLWAEMFRDDDPAIVAAAVKAIIATDEKGFPPSIGAVRAKMRMLTEPEAMTEGEAWNHVKRAIQQAGRYNPKYAYEELPPIIRSCLGSPSTLREWGQIDLNSLNTVVASNFMRTYRAKSAIQQEYAALPSGIKELAESLSGALAFGKTERLTEGEWNSKRNEFMDKLEAHTPEV